jgi:hypothetical protein
LQRTTTESLQVGVGTESNVASQAQAYATLDDPDYWTIVAAAVVVLGNWDGASTFTAGGSRINAVRVVAGRREPGSIQREIPARGHAIESRTRDA